MGGSVSKALGRFSCKSSCSLSQDEKEIWSFHKSLRLDEIAFIKEIIEDWRKTPPTEVLQKKIKSEQSKMSEI